MIQSVDIVSRYYVLVNWKSEQILGIYPGTNRGMKYLSEDLSFETGVTLDEIQYYLYESRDLENLNSVLYESKVGFEVVEFFCD